MKNSRPTFSPRPRAGARKMNSNGKTHPISIQTILLLFMIFVLFRANKQPFQSGLIEHNVLGIQIAFRKIKRL
ncbi:hypothetical protein CRP01_35105 [Flavilitoribacter nigricans DSM 23189 = NBRC 102662]|uniref:Uncharacterized protein n=1 Tax=Flavilitoribacter nigricans (strain ATCC 23147 / DSM 23189 / NBRC 102662 / NCIMB 1420 / SS-2) TaxID=1122177 RepID=A0A2D0N079_FLAN2|nr:hypothetical protein CRP01_35105 [Flavilitoribacter nigricans DSM 23189 = NBRC 102662]